MRAKDTLWWRAGSHSARPIDTTMPFGATRKPENGRAIQASALTKQTAKIAMTGTSTASTQRAVGRLAAALASAALSIAALAPHGPGWLAWGALVPLFVALRDAPARETVGIVIVYALALGVGSLAPWLAPAAAAYFELGAAPALAVVLAFLVGIFALHGAFLGAILAARPRRVGGVQVLWCGAAWAVWDAARTAVFPRFPGAILALSQHAAIPLLQVASVT